MAREFELVLSPEEKTPCERN